MKGTINMENIKIKDYIINNFKDDNKETLRNAICECIKEQDEETLPGMGVFLELIWTNSSDDLKDKMIDNLANSLKKEKE